MNSAAVNLRKIEGGKPPQARYLHKPHYGSSHTWALGHCRALPKSTRVLDIGPGSGFIGEELGSLGFKELFAVESDPHALAHCKRFYKAASATLETFKDTQFDLIVLLDVLEHIPDPEKFFIQVETLLAAGGTLVISVPNITHWSVRLLVLLGKFPSFDRGILDRTHVQFFTRKRLADLIRASGNLKINELKASIEPLEFVLPKLLWQNPIFSLISRARCALANALPGALAYQHLALARKSQ